MSDYHITAKGEEFVDEFQSHWQGAGDPAIAATFLWWMREDGNFQQHFKEVVERSSEQKALQMIEWAINKEYLTQTNELTAEGYHDSPRGRSREEIRTDLLLHEIASKFDQEFVARPNPKPSTKWI